MHGESGPEATGGQKPTNLEDLPSSLLSTILPGAGPHTREVCRAFHALHPPLLSLAPHALPTPEALTAALATLPPTLTALDLAHICLPFDDHFTAAHVATICATCPHLQRLTLPHHMGSNILPTCSQALHRLSHLHTLTFPQHVNRTTLATLYASLALLPHLHTLHAPHTSPEDPNTWGPLLLPLIRPPLATRLRSLSLPCDSIPTLTTSPPATFPHLTSLSLHTDNKSAPAHSPPPVTAAEAASLSAAAPRLLSLHLPTDTIAWPSLFFFSDAPVDTLAALTTLTALCLTHNFSNSSALAATAHPGPLLQHIGTLTHLRSLSLELQHGCDNGAWPQVPAEAGWLPRLTRLTRLAVLLQDKCHDTLDDLVQAQDDDNDDDVHTVLASALVLASVARDAARLPLLQDLHLRHFGCGINAYGFQGSSLGYGTPHSFLRHLAAAMQLRRLHLEAISLPPGETRHLTSLQQLSWLCLVPHIDVPAMLDGAREAPGGDGTTTDLQWVASLQGLRQLHYNHPAGPVSRLAVRSSTVQALVARLPSLHTLSLCNLPPGHDLAAVLECLCDALVWLDLRELRACYFPALGVLGDMARLRGLDVYSARTQGALVPHLWLPGSLRRCYLSPYSGGSDIEGLRQQYPQVAFRLHERPDPLVW